MRILTAQEMRQVDRAAVEELGIPSLLLMENAAMGVVEALGEYFPDAQTVAIFAGPGNNGGDGLALARHLLVRRYRPRIYLVTGGKSLGGDAGTQLAICRKLQIPLVEVAPDASLETVLAVARESDLLVDALFGTGLTRPLEGQFAELVTALSRLPVPRLAVDLPSGLDASRGDLIGPHFQAHLTVTFAAPKVAHLFSPAAEAVGEVVVTDLGIPEELVESAPGGLNLLVGEELAPYLEPRVPHTHKGDYGHVLVVAGSPGKAGAAILTARGAVRSGAGLVTVAVPEPLLGTVEVGSVESMSLPLAAGPAGELAAESVAQVLGAAENKSVLALGPGLGRGPEVEVAIREIVTRCPLPLVLDADGLNAFAGRCREIRGRKAATLLTPHPGELARLLGVESRQVTVDRLGMTERAARETGAVVILKGHRSLVATPEGEIFVNPTGNPGMATGGSGDVLTGMVAALLAQGYDGVAAATLGVYLHGLAGDLEAERRGEVALAAGDLLEALPEAFRHLAAS